MEVLRVMHRPDEFELVALDYCVTYEVSPPSWESARCEYKPLQADGSYAGGHTIIGEAFRDSLSSGLTHAATATRMSAGLSSQHVAGRHGRAGRPDPGRRHGGASTLLDAKLAGADVMVISCARLIRIDFTAAGTLLNWVTRAAGRGPPGAVRRRAPPGGGLLQRHRHQRARRASLARRD